MGGAKAGEHASRIAVETVAEIIRLSPQRDSEVLIRATEEANRRVLDAAHNVASIEALIRALDESFSAAPRLLVFATTQDKDISGMLRLVLPEFDAVIFTRYFNNPRAVPPERLAALAGELSTIPVHTAPDPRAAWNLAQTFAGADHLIAITGSFFIAAEMRAAIRDSPPCAAGTSSHLP
jgi:dihydrofolate synthase/folylpolyglutamate synthase